MFFHQSSDTVEKSFILNKINDELNKIDGKLIYASIFGSKLYGLNTGSSDNDYVCIYLPSKKYLLTNNLFSEKNKFNFTFSTGNNKTRNNNQDIDCSFLSLQTFLLNLSLMSVKDCDILFSLTNKDTIIYNTDIFQKIYNNRLKFLNFLNYENFLFYSINQVKKYGLKGTNVGIAQNLLKRLNTFDLSKKIKLYEIINDIFPILKEAPNFEFIINENKYKESYISLFNSMHQLSISVEEFKRRIQLFYDKYGERAKAAMNNANIDWKAASHGLRSLYIIYDLLTTSKYTYPFTNEIQNILLDVKLGKCQWINYEKMFLEQKNKIINFVEKNNIQNNFDKSFIINFILEQY